MTQIILTSEQVAVFDNAESPVVIFRPDGTIAGLVSSTCRVVMPTKPLFSVEEVEEAERQLDADTVGSTTQQVLDRLNWNHEGEDPDFAESYLPKA